jgi:hypothetical protein
VWKITALLCALIGATLPLSLLPGSPATALAGALASAVLIGAFLAIRPGELAFLRSVGTVLLFAGLIPPFWMVLQILPISGLAHPVWKQAADVLEQPVSGSVSVDIGATLHALLTYLAGFAVALSASAVAVDPLRARWLLNAILATTIALSLLALVQTIVTLPAWSGAPPSPPILAILIGVQSGAASMLEGVDKWRSRRGARFETELALSISAVVIGLIAVTWNAGASAAIPALAGSAFILMIGTFRTFRIPLWASGVTALTLSGVALAGAIAFRRHPDVPLAIAFVAAPDEAIQLSLSILADLPLFGTGAGTTDALLPTYADLSQADLQPAMSSAASALMTEYGIPIFWIMVGLVATTIAVFFTGALGRGRDWSFAASAAGVLVALLAAAFSLPTMLTVAGVVLLGAVIGSAVAQRVSRSRSRIG